MTPLRAFLLALLVSLLVGLAIGIALRQRLERPARYIGSAPPALPLDVGNAGAAVLEASQDEEQIG